MTRLSRDEKKALIIRAAAGVFAEKGFVKTLMAEVAAAAGIGKGTVYEYFRSKDDLFFAVYESVIQESSGTADAALARAGRKDAAGKLLALNKAIAAWIAAHKHLYTLSLEFWAASISASPVMRRRFEQSVRDIYATFRQNVTGILQEGVVAGTFKKNINAGAVASAILGSWDGLGLQAWFDPAFDLEKTAEAYIRVLIRGLQDGEQ